MTLRLRPDVYDAVQVSARRKFRSITEEINELLSAATAETASGAKPGSTTPDALASQGEA